jgi:preprotein translocase subunit YajC
MPAAALLILALFALFGMQVFSQRRRVGAHQALLSQLATGDEVITSGGLIGVIVELGDAEVSLEVAPGTVVRLALPAVIGRPRPAAPAASEDPVHKDAD